MIDIKSLPLTGEKVIDREHRQMVRNINAVYRSIQNDASVESASEKLSNMIIFAREHFKHEEKLMDSLDYPDSIKHKNEHQRIIQHMQVAIMQCREDNNTEYLENRLKEHIETWVLKHIRDMDIPLQKLKHQLDDGQ